MLKKSPDSESGNAMFYRASLEKDGHLPTAHHRRDICAYPGGWGKVVGMYEKYGEWWEKRLVCLDKLLLTVGIIRLREIN